MFEDDLPPEPEAQRNPDTFDYHGLRVTPLAVDLLCVGHSNPYAGPVIKWWTCELAVPGCDIMIRTKPKYMREWAINEAKIVIDRMRHVFSYQVGNP